MTKRGTSTSHKDTRTILGISLDPAVAAEVKAEADKRGILLKTLFAEMWQVYKKSPRPK